MRLIGITGRAGSGKSLVAFGLAEQDSYEVISFATPLKRMAVNFLIDNYGYDRPHAELYLTHKTIKIPELGITMRYLLQTLGTDWGRTLINRYIWTNIAADDIAEQLDWTDVVVDDVRFESEADLIRNFGGLIIHLVRAGGTKDDHASESGVTVKAGDAMIANCGTVEELMGAVDHAIERFYFDTERLLDLCHTPCRSYRA